MDDIVLTDNDNSKIKAITNHLHVAFKIKDLGNLKFFLGFEVARNLSRIHICQRKYALDILNDSGMLASKLVTTPMDSGTRLHVNSGIPLSDSCSSSYRCLIGRLIYLTNTRLDITYAVQHLSQFVSNPTTAHQQATYRILRYIKGVPRAGLFFPAKNTPQLKGYNDSD